MKCKVCNMPDAHVRKHGFYRSVRGFKKFQRYKCLSCLKTFSSKTNTFQFRQKREDLMQPIFQKICSGMSQRRIALELKTTQATVARKLKIIAKISREKCRKLAKYATSPKTIIFDEMETFEHTKCKPLSIVAVVDEKSRSLMALRQCRMPAKGLLAKIARKRYGPREDHRRITLKAVMRCLRPWIHHTTIFKSDECPRYPSVLKDTLDNPIHLTFEGRRGCIVGQGELKSGGNDPLFALNHTCAMVRDNIKRLSRRTWCTTKKPKMLQTILDIYRWFHNQIVRIKGKIPRLFASTARLDYRIGIIQVV